MAVHLSVATHVGLHLISSMHDTNMLIRVVYKMSSALMIKILMSLENTNYMFCGNPDRVMALVTICFLYTTTGTWN